MASSTDSTFTVPLNVITKIIAETVPEDISVQEDFIKALSRATSLFILYSTTRANQIATENNRRTVYSQDLLNAISILGFDHYVEDLIKWHTLYTEEKESLKVRKKKSTDDGSTSLLMPNMQNSD